MNTDKKQRFRPEKYSDGTDVYCPLDSKKKTWAGPLEQNGDCIEKDVVERYSGNIDIEN